MPVRVRSSGGRSGSWEVGHEGASGVPRRRMGFACAKSKVISVYIIYAFSLPYAQASTLWAHDRGSCWHVAVYDVKRFTFMWRIFPSLTLALELRGESTV